VLYGESIVKWYLVSLQGQNLHLNYKGDLAKYSFHTKRYVQADNGKQAEEKALDLIMEDPELHAIIQNEEDDLPTMTVENIQEVDRPKENVEENVKNLFYKEHEA